MYSVIRFLELCLLVVEGKPARREITPRWPRGFLSHDSFTKISCDSCDGSVDGHQLTVPEEITLSHYEISQEPDFVHENVEWSMNFFTICVSLFLRPKCGKMIIWPRALWHEGKKLRKKKDSWNCGVSVHAFPQAPHAAAKKIDETHKNALELKVSSYCGTILVHITSMAFFLVARRFYCLCGSGPSILWPLVSAHGRCCHWGVYPTHLLPTASKKAG